MKNEEGLFNAKSTTNSREVGYGKLIARRCAHRETNNNVEPVQQNGKPRPAFPKPDQSHSAPSSPRKSYRPCCAPASWSTSTSKTSSTSTSTTTSSKSPTPSVENKFTSSEPCSPRRKVRVLLRQSALKVSSKESLIMSDQSRQKHEQRDRKHDDLDRMAKNINNNNVAEILVPEVTTTTSRKLHSISNKSNIIVTTSARNSQRSRKCTGNNGMSISNGNSGGGGGGLGEPMTLTKFNPAQVGRERRGQNGHDQQNFNMTMTKGIIDNKDVASAKMEVCGSRHQTVSTSSCISTAKPSQPQFKTQSSRKGLHDICPISTTTTLTLTNKNRTTSANPHQPSSGSHSLNEQQQSRKLISREKTVLFLNGHGKDTKEKIHEPTRTKTFKSLNLSPALNLSNGNPVKNPNLTNSSVNNPRKMENGHLHNGNGAEYDGSGDKIETTGIKFIQPLEPNLEFLEGSDFQLSVKIQGAKRVVWVKNDQIVPNIPPDFEYKSNPQDGTFSLRIHDAFLEDSGLYICEAYGSDEESDAICWSHVDIFEEGEEDDTSIELEEEPQPTRRFIVPLIITSDASEDPPFVHSKGMDAADEKRLKFQGSRDISTNSSRDVFEDALEVLEPNLSNGTEASSSNFTLTEDQLQPQQHINVEDVLCYSQTEQLLDGDNSSVALSMSPSDLHTPAVQYQLDLNDSESSFRDIETQKSFSDDSLQSSPPNVPYGLLHRTSLNSAEVDSSFCISELDAAFNATPDIGSPNLSLNATNDELQLLVDSNSTTLFPSQNTDESVEEEMIEEHGESSTASFETMIAMQATDVSQSENEQSLNPTLDTASMYECGNRTLGSADSDIINDVVVKKIDPIPSNPGFIGKRLSSQSSTESSCGSDALNFNSSSMDDTLSSLNQSPEVGDTPSPSSAPRQLQPRDSLTDQLPPRILIGPSNLIAILGETVNLRVKIQSTDEANTKIGWCKFVRGIYRRLGKRPESDEVEDQSSHLQIKKVNRDLITLSINDVNYEDSGKYRVKVENLYGIDYHHCILSVEGPPEAPSTPPKAKYDPISNAILISWHSCPYDGGSAVTGYSLEGSLHPLNNNSDSNGTDYDNNWTVLTPTSFKWLCYTLESPLPAHSYRFRVSVENAYGKGRPSKPSNGIVINLESGSHSGLPENPDRTVSLNYNHTFKSTGPSYEYKNVILKCEPFLQYYDKFEQLGKGRFGVVFKVTNKASKKSYAGKFVKCIKAKDKERAQLEYKIMDELKYHPKLICLADAFEMHREFVIVTELISGGELFERVVADDFTLTESDCVAFLRQICDGVTYIHQKNIMHLDLKPENILCTTKTSNQIKIIDFGLAQHYNPEDPISVLFGTAEFVSPEIINYDTICPATDMWSIGVITYILLSGLSPFLGDNDNETFSNITRGEFDFEDESFDNISDEAKDFISSLIIKRKEKRLTAVQCLEHQWLALSDAEKKDIVLPTEKLKRFLVRRKWQKTGNAIRALGRITTLYSSRKSSASSTSSSSPLGLLNRNFSNQDSVEFDSVFNSLDAPVSPDVSVPLNFLNNNNVGASGTNTVVSSPTSKNSPDPSVTSEESEPNKPKYNDNSRSDSGVCDVVSAPVTPTPQE